MALPTRRPHVARSWDLHGLEGISDRTLELHFKLYQGYVKETNRLEGEIAGFLRDGKLDREELPAYSELTRRLGFECNGMLLHELYFDGLMRKGGEEPTSGSPFRKAAQASFGSYELWKTDFTGVGTMRGVGWAICSLDPASGRVSNHWISEHQVGHVAGSLPLVVLDVWEHAFLLDYAPSERADYIEAWFGNLDWSAIESRLQPARPALAARS
jgi:superoxide dismutase, Fe-Mn family